MLPAVLMPVTVLVLVVALVISTGCPNLCVCWTPWGALVGEKPPALL